MIRLIPEQRRNLDRAARQEEQMQRPLSRRGIQTRWDSIVRIEDHCPQDDDCGDKLIVVDNQPNGRLIDLRRGHEAEGAISLKAVSK